MISALKKAWIAGIIDGEGYITRVKASKNTTRIVVKVANTDKKMLKELSKYFGGNIYLNKRKNRPNSKPCWYWCLVCKKAEHFLTEIQPYLITKQELALEILNS